MTASSWALLRISLLLCRSLRMSALPWGCTSTGASLSSTSPRMPMPPPPPITRCGFFLLVCPVGPPDFCEEVFQARLEKVKASLDAQWNMGDSQLKTTLLRSCLALPKVAFVHRTCHIHVGHTAKEFDSAIRCSLESIISRPVSDWLWLKASLTSSRGGLNLRSASLHAPAAFLASSQRLVEDILSHHPGPSPHTNPTVSILTSALTQPNWQCFEDIDIPIHQHFLSAATDESAPLISLLNSVPCSGSFYQLATCW